VHATAHMFLEQDLIKDWHTKNERFKAILQETNIIIGPSVE